MCCGCWEEKGAPATVTPEILLAAQFIKANEETLQFGPCHVMVGDANVEDDHLDSCREQCGKPDPYDRGDRYADLWEQESANCRVAVMLMRSLTVDERVTVMAIVDGCIVPPSS